MTEYPLPTLSVLPRDLVSCNRWLGWEYRLHNGKTTKVPIDAVTGEPGSSTDPQTWCTAEQAVRLAEKMGHGVGFVLSGVDDILGIDIDHVQAGDSLDPVWLAIIRWLGGYAELSPGGDGAHVYVRGRIPGERRRRGNVEMYSDGRFFTVTGSVIVPCEMLPVGDDVDQRIAQFYARFLGAGDAARPSSPKRIDGAAVDAAAAVSRMKASARWPLIAPLWLRDEGELMRRYGQGGSFDESAADMALVGELRYWCGGNATMIDEAFRLSGLYRPKWDEMRGAETYGQITIRKALS